MKTTSSAPAAPSSRPISRSNPTSMPGLTERDFEQDSSHIGNESQQSGNNTTVDLLSLADGRSQQSDPVRPDGRSPVKTVDANDLRKAAKEKDPFKSLKEDAPKAQDDPNNEVEVAQDSPEAKTLEIAAATSLSIEAPELEEETSTTQTTEVSDGTVGKDEKRARDYTQFNDPDFAMYAKKLPNDAFARLTKKFADFEKEKTEVKQLKEVLAKAPTVPYEQEGGYVMDPNWKNVTNAFNAYQFEANHWDAQRDRIEAGEAWQDFRGFDKDGQPILVTIPAPENGIVNRQHLKAVERAFMKADSDLNRTRDNAAGIINNHQQRVQQTRAGMTEMRKKLFPKSYEYEKLDGPDKKNFQLAASLFEPQYRENPFVINNCLAYVEMAKWSVAAGKIAAENKRLKAMLNGQKASGNISLPSTALPDKDGAAGDMINLRELAKSIN
jgi:hypothetical protein